ncbi:hypothetical protein P8C59_006169 [Phyllachora maydis]|uniref:Uncharacterized protein n=1 Tax=Phyllachora maydis TaxID=1825666 RepID=A0AAD9I7N7_9PEZI|nr:hypothetical protein P8C59_006169 [Phyllachora maydis]
MSSMAQPMVPADSNAHMPPISSPLNPGGSGGGVYLYATTPKRPGRRRVAISPTQRLLRKKAAAAWDLRRALATERPPYKVLTKSFRTANPEERGCQVHIMMTTGPMDPDDGDIGLTINKFANLHGISAKQTFTMSTSCPHPRFWPRQETVTKHAGAQTVSRNRALAT